ncbi:hypothetical protein VP01_2020g3 [Puccinia sorghi]|uniref:Uncharacterized protein n=1 Tax=Puccinia sorghi TaxID=27349 RepID=A0A0L6VBR0_9BASI|nr:hypothetical protein VP01_2020g3 [Puccinia sorghi]
MNCTARLVDINAGELNQLIKTYAKAWLATNFFFGRVVLFMLNGVKLMEAHYKGFYPHSQCYHNIKKEYLHESPHFPYYPSQSCYDPVTPSGTRQGFPNWGIMTYSYWKYDKIWTWAINQVYFQPDLKCNSDQHPRSYQQVIQGSDVKALACKCHGKSHYNQGKFLGTHIANESIILKNLTGVSDHQGKFHENCIYSAIKISKKNSPGKCCLKVKPMSEFINSLYTSKRGFNTQATRGCGGPGGLWDQFVVHKSLQKKLDMQIVPGSFCCYSNLSPRVIQSSFAAQSLRILHSDCTRTYTYANRWSLDERLAGACCMSTIMFSLIFWGKIETNPMKIIF